MLFYIWSRKIEEENSASPCALNYIQRAFSSVSPLDQNTSRTESPIINYETTFQTDFFARYIIAFICNAIAKCHRASCVPITLQLKSLQNNSLYSAVSCYFELLTASHRIQFIAQLNIYMDTIMRLEANGGRANSSEQT